MRELNRTKQMKIIFIVFGKGRWIVTIKALQIFRSFTHSIISSEMNFPHKSHKSHGSHNPVRHESYSISAKRPSKCCSRATLRDRLKRISVSLLINKVICQ